MTELQERIIKVLSLLKEATKDMPPPMSTMIAQKYGRDPFLIFISCLLSLRARDPVTYQVSQKLFARVRTPQELVLLDRSELEKLFYPLGFYRKKAQTVTDACHILLERFQGKVPATEEELLSIKGVGRKTANLVLGEAFGIPAICVDTHVHRLANRLGWVETKDPTATEYALRALVPRDYWISLNHLLVMWGQNICVPISPFCSRCIVRPYCPQKGVKKKR